jgi:hypothetical protein
MITVDFREVKFHLFKSHTFERVKCEEIESELLPRKGDFVFIDSTRFIVEQVVFYPFGDSDGTKGAIIYIRKS